MGVQFKAVFLLSGVLVLCTSVLADKIPSRPTSTYGLPSGITVAGPNTDLGGFTQTIVCGKNTEPTNLTTCDALTITPGVFDLLVDTPALATGTIVTLKFDSSAFNASNTFGLLTGCDQQFTSFASCINISNIDANCINSVFNGLSGTDSTVSFTVPSCASKGVTLFFDETLASFASISTTSAVATPEPNSALLVLLGVIPVFVLGRRLLNQ
jgi:hypothetical protein